MSDQPVVLVIGGLSFELTALSVLEEADRFRGMLVIRAEHAGAKFEGMLSFADADRLAHGILLLTGPLLDSGGSPQPDGGLE